MKDYTVTVSLDVDEDKVLRDKCKGIGKKEEEVVSELATAAVNAQITAWVKEKIADANTKLKPVEIWARIERYGVPE